MDTFEFVIIGMYSVWGITFLVLVGYFAYKRLSGKKQENFQKRDN